jgi:hypothetical protein
METQQKPSKWYPSTILILEVKRAANSANGNPRYELLGSFEGSNKVDTFLTMSDHMELYMHDWYSFAGKTIECLVKHVGVNSKKLYVSTIGVVEDSIKKSTADQLDIAAIRKTLLPTNDESFKQSAVECFTEYCHEMAAADVKANCTQMCDDRDIKWVYMSAIADFADDYVGDDAEVDADRLPDDLREMRKIARAWREEAKELSYLKVANSNS